MTTTTDTPDVAESRERFERWYRQAFYWLGADMHKRQLSRTESGYFSSKAQGNWTAWEACRTFERKAAE